jgi:hypothetical protein
LTAAPGEGSMDVEGFIKANDCTHIYHMAEKGSWPSIQKFGLLSTSALLDLCSIAGKDRFAIESQLRSDKVQIRHPAYGEICIRDQDPMRDRPVDGIFLARLLEAGTTMQGWLEFLNRKTFFWVSEREFKKMLCARLYRNRPHWVLVIDARAFLEQYADKASVSDQNSGSLYSKKTRGPSTFVPLLRCQTKSNIVELAVDYAVPNIERFTTSVVECVGTWRNGDRVCTRVRQVWPQGV